MATTSTFNNAPLVLAAAPQTRVFQDNKPQYEIEPGVPLVDDPMSMTGVFTALGINEDTDAAWAMVPRRPAQAILPDEGAKERKTDQMRAVTREILDERRKFCPVFSGNLGTNILEVARRMPEMFARARPPAIVSPSGSQDATLNELRETGSLSPESGSERGKSQGSPRTSGD